MRQLTAIFSTLVLLGAGSALAVPAKTTGDGVTRSGALAFAAQFAEALDADPKDKARAQEGVALEYARRGAFDAALEQAGRIDGWRRAVATADIASLAAERGVSKTARQALAEARRSARGVEGWQALRVRAHIAQALARLGELDEAVSIARTIGEQDREYAGRAVATVALAHAVRGNVAEARERLRRIDDEPDYVIAWWRTRGYVELAKLETLERTDRREAARAAHTSASGVYGWKRADSLIDVSAALRLVGLGQEAERAIGTAEPAVLRLADTMPAKPGLLVRLALERAAMGEPERAKELLEAAKQTLGQTLNIERPGVLARIASARRTLGDEEGAALETDEALRLAEGLVNARPRVLAVVEICRALSAADWSPDAVTRARLERLYGGLGAPW